MTVPAFAADPDDLAELAQVEAALDERWPETRIEPSLTRISGLMQLLGSPQDAYPSIQIAGTNGKSSTARMIDSLLLAFSRRTGRITSPHLQLATERIAVDGVPLTAKRYVETYRELEPFIELVDQQSEAADGPRMSKFEVLTAMAFAAFAEAPVDVAVVEVGLGGTWDATNVVTAEVAVITPIGLDHVEILGPDIPSIAGEKAGIIKRAPERLIPKDTVVVVGKQEPAAMDVVLRKAVEADAAVAREGSEFMVVERRVAVGGQQLTLQGLGGVYDEIFLPLHGEHQANNAAVALAAVEAFFGAGSDQQLDVNTVREGFAKAASPGRLERVRTAPTVLIDAAHNPHGAQALARTIETEFGFHKLIGVISVLADKDAIGVLTALEPVLDTIVVTHNGSPRALEVERLAAVAEEIFGEDRVVTSPTMVDAVETAVALADDESDDGFDAGAPASGVGVLITGSVVTAGAARSLFGKEPQ